MTHSRCKTSDVLWMTIAAAILGGATGFVLGILYAPAPGNETKRRMVSFGLEARSSAARAVEEARRALGDAARGLERGISGERSRVQRGLQRVRRELDSLDLSGLKE